MTRKAKRKRRSVRDRSAQTGQELFSFADTRKARRGKKLGRPRKRGSGVPHVKRECVSDREPQHVTVRLVEGLPSLRSGEVLDVLRRVFRAARDRLGMRLCHWSVQTNHIHLIVEAEDAETLSRGMNGLLTRISRRVSALWRRAGRFFADRFQAAARRDPLRLRMTNGPRSRP